MKNQKKWWIILAAIMGGFLLIQLVPVWNWQTNPAITSEPNWDTSGTRSLAERACFDCHSNETVWPWYAHVAPVSWLVTIDVVNGRSNMNFSEWNSETGYLLREAGEVISEGEMPPPQYLWMHPEAKLSAEEKQQLIDGLLATAGQ